ncbi:DUF4446 family protein [Clostridium sp.]|uniref:DUF4446 family protein n=1 Tax=Clostridium sp. TaxID=1506 RepID=UPI00261A4653|nr:DUF4446 family protein [Clostridium sp.]
MENVLELLGQYSTYITIGLIGLVIIQFIMLLIAFRSLSKVEKKFRRIMRGVNNKNLEELINSRLDKIDEIKEASEEILNANESLKTQLEKCTQKVSVIRYKAFEDVGSDLSFSVALLDGENNGIILTGIYGRDYSTTYAKPIDKGISRYDLSEEELHVLNSAMNK